MSLERVQKILAQAGVASRRKAEELITEGLVTINGKPAKLGDKAQWGKDAIKVKGKLLHQKDTPVYWAFYKPKNVICMLSDPQDRPTLGDYLRKIEERVFPIGRLDFTSEGLVLLTNDGDFAEKLQKHKDILRIYHVKVKGHPDSEMLSRLHRSYHEKRLSSSFRPPKKSIKPHSIRVLQSFNNKSLIEVVIQGGGAIDIQVFFEIRGFLVDKITRFALGHLTLLGFRPGEMRRLKSSQVQALLKQPELAQRRWEQDVKTSRPRVAATSTKPKIQPVIKKQIKSNRNESYRQSTEPRQKGSRVGANGHRVRLRAK